MRSIPSMPFLRPGTTALLATLLAVGTSTPTAAQDAAPLATPAWTLAAPASDKVEFRGLASFDQAGVDHKSALMVGVGNSALLAATAVSFALNAAFIGSARESQKNSLQVEANKVLAPYQAVLADWRSSDLFARALARAQKAAVPPAATRAWQFAATPVFSMTQDQKAIVLDSLIEVRAAGASAPLFAAPLRVVAAPIDDADPAAHWNAQQGQALRSTSEELLAQALQLAVVFADPAAPPAPGLGAKSMRFMQGATEHVERGEVVSQDCARTVFRTLRGSLMSVPVHRPDPACIAAPAMTTASATPSVTAASSPE